MGMPAIRGPAICSASFVSPRYIIDWLMVFLAFLLVVVDQIINVTFASFLDPLAKMAPALFLCVNLAKSALCRSADECGRFFDEP